jgi:hypothetical protein
MDLRAIYYIQDDKIKFKMTFYHLNCLINRKECKVSSSTYLTTDELSARIKYDVRTIRERLKDSVLLEGVHYFRPFGGRKILYLWDAIERDMQKLSQIRPIGLSGIPMANGSMLHA